MDSDPQLLILAALFGAIVGSFLNVVILRLPEPGESIVFPPSHCPVCKARLAWFENIPIVSYLLLRGKCGHCSCRISIQYPLVEFSMACLSAGVLHQFGMTVPGAGYFLFCASLVVIICIDLHHQIIPDVVSLPGILIGFCLSFFSPLVSWQASLIGILAGGGSLGAVALLYYLLRKQEGMGGGDIKLLAMIGAFLGWQALPFVIFSSSLTGAIVGIIVMLIQRKKGLSMRIPFGPFLSLAALAYLFFSETINHTAMIYLTGEFY
jgi:leader peptidase (prepilin peptidase)/N-methyltransferase